MNISKMSDSDSDGSLSPKRRRYNDEAEEGEEEDVADEQEPEGRDLDSDDDDDYRKKKKGRQANVRDFFIEEAEVDSDDEEDEDAWRDEGQDDLDLNEADEAGQTAADVEARLRQRDRKMGRRDDMELDEREIEEYYRSRYNEDTAAIARFGEGGEEMGDEITQQELLPEVKDPNLWMVKCRIGEEKQTVLLLMRKIIAYQHEEEPLQIRSVVAPEHVKGMIYIEAFKQSHVKAAIDGVSNLRGGMYSQQMVPIKEMTDVMRVVKEQAGIKKGQWVRIKRGLYKDDLAQVFNVDLASNQVYLRLLPRIDYSRKRGALRSNDELFKKNKFKRPPCKLFEQEKIRSIGGEISSDGDYLVFEGNKYSRKGFLFKAFVMNAILAEGVKPSLAELERFEETPEGIDIDVGVADKEEAAHAFSNGDMVEVVEGELQNLQGRVIAIDGSKITIMPKHEDLKDPLEFQSSELKKYFKQVKSQNILNLFLTNPISRETMSELSEEDMKETQV